MMLPLSVFVYGLTWIKFGQSPCRAAPRPDLTRFGGDANFAQASIIGLKFVAKDRRKWARCGPEDGEKPDIAGPLRPLPIGREAYRIRAGRRMSLA